MWIVFQKTEIDFQTCLIFASARYKMPCVAKDTKFKMNLSDNCAMSNHDTSKGSNSVDALHAFHTCLASGENGNFTCPICRRNIDESEACIRGKRSQPLWASTRRQPTCGCDPDNWKVQGEVEEDRKSSSVTSNWRLKWHAWRTIVPLLWFKWSRGCWSKKMS